MKTKTFKRLAAAAAAVMMMGTISMSAMPIISADTSITISNTGTYTGTHSYKAYQIFKGDYYIDSEDNNKKTLLNIQWADGIAPANITAILQALVEANTDTNSALNGKFAGITTSSEASQVADKIKEFTADSKEAFAFAEIIASKIGTSGTPLTPGTPKSVAEGYYLILDDASNIGTDARSARILQVVGEETITPKISQPELHKKIGTEWASGVTANTEMIGNEVDYMLQSKVPDMRGYNQYYYIIEDEMSDGLDLVYNSTDHTGFTVKVGSTTLDYASGYGDTGTTYYVVQSGRKFKIVFNNFIQYASQADAAITVSYKAELNDNASFSTQAASSNKNTVKLVYSNDPNENYDGKPDNPSTTENDPRPYEPNSSDPNDTPDNPFDDTPTDPVGNTPQETVYTYTAKLTITKLDGESQNNPKDPLMGAGFKILSADKSSEVLAEQITNSGNKGVLEFKSLKSGTYYVRESTVPTGYNQAPDYKLVLTATPTNTGCTWDITGSDSIFSLDGTVTNSAEYISEIENNKGTTLPSTGGIGTTIFYVSGGTLILGAVVVMITKKRMSLKEDK